MARARRQDHRSPPSRARSKDEKPKTRPAIMVGTELAAHLRSGERGRFSLGCTGKARDHRLDALKKRAAALDGLQRRIEFERIADEFSSAARQFPLLDFHLAEWPESRVRKGMRQPPNVAAGPDRETWWLPPVRWFAPGRTLWCTLHYRCGLSDADITSRALLRELMQRLSVAVNPAGRDPFADPTTWWLLKVHQWWGPEQFLWEGGTLIEFGGVREGAPEDCLTSSIPNVLRVFRDCIETLLTDQTDASWVAMDIGRPPMVRDAAQSLVQLPPLSIEAACTLFAQPMYPHKLNKWIDLGRVFVDPGAGRHRSFRMAEAHLKHDWRERLAKGVRGKRKRRASK